MKRSFLPLVCAILALIVLMSALVSCSAPEKTDEDKYNEALALIEDGKYEEAYAAFKALGDYKDSSKYLSRFVYFPTVLSYVLSDRSGVMTVTFGKHNLPYNVVSEGNVGKKDSTYTFDDIGNLLNQTMLYNGDTLTYDYSYDSENRHTEALYSVNGVVMHAYNYIYNEQGQITNVLYKEGGVLIEEYIYSFDDDGNMTECIYMAGGETVCTYTYICDKDGNRTREYAAYQDGYYTIDYVYGANGKLAHEIYKEGETQIVVDYTYDANGNCIEEACIYPDGAREYLVKVYDENGNVIKEIRTDKDGFVKTVETEYALKYTPVDVPESSMNNILSSVIITTDY